MASSTDQTASAAIQLAAATSPAGAALAAATALLPTSMRQVRVHIANQRQVVTNLKAQEVSAQTLVQLQQIKAAKAREASKLAALVLSAKKKQARADAKQAGILAGAVRIDDAIAKRALVGVLAEQRSVLAQMHALSGKPAAQTQLRILQARNSYLVSRAKLLAKGQDIETAAVISPSGIYRVQRIALILPAKMAMPSVGTAGVVTRLIAMNLARKAGEAPMSYRNRLRAYLKRALARLAILHAARVLAVNHAADPATLAPSSADVQQAVSDTITQDSSALESEAASGGETADPAAEVMAPAARAAADQIAAAEEDTTPAPAGVPTDAQVDATVAAATGAESDLVSAPADASDHLAAAAVAASTPFYEKPVVVIGVVAAAGLALWLSKKGAS